MKLNDANTVAASNGVHKDINKKSCCTENL